MKYKILILSILVASSTIAQSIKTEKITPQSDTTKAEGDVYSKGSVAIHAKSDISAAMMNINSEIKNTYDKYVYIESANTTLNYRKTTKNSKGISKTSDKSETIKLEDVILKPQSSIVFKKSEQLDKEAGYGIAILEGSILEDKVLLLEPSSQYKVKLGATPEVCGGFYDIQFSIYTKQVKVDNAYLSDGFQAMKMIPYLVLKNKSKRDVSFKGDLEVTFSYNGYQRTLKFGLPDLAAGEQKEREAKGDIPICNYVADVFFLQMLNTPQVTFKE